MTRGQRAVQVQPAGVSEDAGHDIAVLAAASAIPAVAGALATVVLA